MKTLQRLKLKMKADNAFQRMLLGSETDEILLDLDGDGKADLALTDTEGSGEIDFLAVDLGGNGFFDLYVGDTDAYGSPTVILYDGRGNEIPGGTADLALLSAVSLVRSAVITGDYIPDTLEAKLEELKNRLGRVRTSDSAEHKEEKQPCFK